MNAPYTALAAMPFEAHEIDTHEDSARIWATIEAEKHDVREDDDDLFEDAKQQVGDESFDNGYEKALTDILFAVQAAKASFIGEEVDGVPLIDIFAEDLDRISLKHDSREGYEIHEKLTELVQGLIDSVDWQE